MSVFYLRLDATVSQSLQTELQGPHVHLRQSERAVTYYHRHSLGGDTHASYAIH